jgi:hypothetical protein
MPLPPHVRLTPVAAQLFGAQVIVGLGQVAGLVTVPQSSPAGQVVGQLTQAPVLSQVRPAAHVPQVTVPVPGQPSGCVPHCCPPVHAVFGVHPQ